MGEAMERVKVSELQAHVHDLLPWLSAAAGCGSYRLPSIWRMRTACMACSASSICWRH